MARLLHAARGPSVLTGPRPPEAPEICPSLLTKSEAFGLLRQAWSPPQPCLHWSSSSLKGSVICRSEVTPRWPCKSATGKDETINRWKNPEMRRELGVLTRVSGSEGVRVYVSTLQLALSLGALLPSQVGFWKKQSRLAGPCLDLPGAAAGARGSLGTRPGPRAGAGRGVTSARPRRGCRAAAQTLRANTTRFLQAVPTDNDADHLLRAIRPQGCFTVIKCDGTAGRALGGSSPKPQRALLQQLVSHRPQEGAQPRAEAPRPLGGAGWALSETGGSWLSRRLSRPEGGVSGHTARGSSSYK